MNKSYGQCVGCKEALAWVESIETDDIKKTYVLNRMRYEFDKDIPVIPTLIKGVYSRRYDKYYCGNCRYGDIQVHEKYCPNCGFRIDWDRKWDAKAIEDNDDEERSDTGIKDTAGDKLEDAFVQRSLFDSD